MDKTWMYMSRLSQEYEDRVDVFLNFALTNGGDTNLLPCPCVFCGNLKKISIGVVKEHLITKGMNLNYKTWIWHGEERTSSQSTHDRFMFDESDTKGSVERPIDMIHDVYDAYEDNPRHFHKLIENAEKQLYPGCSRFTKLSATVKLFNLKAKYSWSDNSFNDLLQLLTQMLPKCNELPPSTYEAKKTLSTLGLEYEKIHACPNDSILYRKEFKDSNDCPTCQLSRWKVDKNNNPSFGVPAKVLLYFPPMPRFRRMFRTKEISKELTWHANNRTCDGFLRHPADALAWKLVDNKRPEFGKEPTNLRLAVATDGINPYVGVNIHNNHILLLHVRP